MDNMIRVVHYLNQFFGQIGGEKEAGIGPQIKTGPVGPGRLLQNVLAQRGEVIATIICGDDYFSNFAEKAKEEIFSLIKSTNPDILIAGPAFNAGRYGIACGEICKTVNEQLNLPTVTGMFSENPGLESYRRFTYIFETPGSAAGMKRSLPKMAEFAMKLAKGEAIGPPAEEGYFPKGIRKNVFSQKMGAERLIDMLMSKMAGISYSAEVSNDLNADFKPAPPIKSITKARIGLVTEGALVPKGNPDRIEGARCTKFARYDLWSERNFPSEQFECIHRGFDTTLINEDPHRLLPIDVLTDILDEGGFAELYPSFYCTCGCGTYVNEAKRIGREIAEHLKNERINGVILPAT